MATTAIKKERMVRAKVFPKPPQLTVLEVILGQGNTHRIIINEDIRKVLFDQSIKKAPGPTKLNFKAMRLLWRWDQIRIQDIMRHALRLRHHPNN